MGTTLTRWLAAFAFIAAAAACMAQPQIVGSRGPMEYGIIPDPQPGGDFVASVSVEKQSYDIGEPIDITFRVSRDAHVFIFSRDPAGVEQQIFPNYYEQSNFVRANRSRTIPSGGYGLQVTGPHGRNEITLVAVREDYPFLRDWRRFSRTEPYPSARGGAAAIAGQARNAQSPRGGVETRGVQPVPPAQRVAEASTWFAVRDQGHRPGGRYGSVAVQTEPRGATVYLDGRRIGYSPVAERRIQPGDTTLRIELPGYWTYERDVLVQRGETSIVRLRMEPLRD